jgi:hypothetical protein
MVAFFLGTSLTAEAAVARLFRRLRGVLRARCALGSLTGVLLLLTRPLLHVGQLLLLLGCEDRLDFRKLGLLDLADFRNLLIHAHGLIIAHSFDLAHFFLNDGLQLCFLGVGQL